MQGNVDGKDERLHARVGRAPHLVGDDDGVLEPVKLEPGMFGRDRRRLLDRAIAVGGHDERHIRGRRGAGELAVALGPEDARRARRRNPDRRCESLPGQRSRKLTLRDIDQISRQ